jgi:hypothetical protein
LEFMLFLFLFLESLYVFNMKPYGRPLFDAGCLPWIVLESCCSAYHSKS